MFRFLHSSDLHVGKRFGSMPEELRGRLREARHAAIGRLAARAAENGAGVVLLAGDTFDTETPTPSILRQALAEMGGHASLTWVILPGNHDSLRADELWSAARAALPPNVVLATEARPRELAPGVTLLAAPCTTRRAGRDLTEWFDAAPTPEATLRIGLAHGPVHDFSEDGGGTDVVAPDRAERAGLDYLALGDWHGQVRIGPRAWYSGAPEPDRFRHGRPGEALLVAIAGRGAAPEVSPLATGSFEWRTLALDLVGDADPAAALAAGLPSGMPRRQILLRIAATGRASMAARTALARSFDAVAPEFAHALLDTEGLATECEAGELDLIDRAGALRQAAEALLAESADERLPDAGRDVARRALARLFSYCEAMRP